MTSNPRRLLILSASEIEELYGLPHFNEDERQYYFSLSPKETSIVNAQYTMSISATLILQLGYFKAKQQFFEYEQLEVIEDIQYIIARYFPYRDLVSFKRPSRPIDIQLRRVILKLFNFRLSDKHSKQELERKAKHFAKISSHPVYIFRELMGFLNETRQVAPSYRFFQELIGRVVSEERKRLTQLLNNHLTSSAVKQLDLLLQNEEGINRISLLKHEPRDFSYKELQKEITRRKFFHPLYLIAQQFFGIADTFR